MELKRKKFQGVLNILSFNRHFYFFGGIALLVILGSTYLVHWNNSVFWVVLIGFLYGLTMPLIVSAYVYDYSGFYNFLWLKRLGLLDTEEKLNVNINAGFDETSYILKQTLPNAHLQVYDFYNAHHHTEPAIIRARKVSVTYPNTTQINTSNIPLKDNTVDHIFLLSAIHEIRKHEEKVQFLKECKRVCKPDGSIVIVEHLRDIPNFFAFTIGFTHFFSRTVWKKALNQAGFTHIKETKFTPFMSIFNCN